MTLIEVLKDYRVKTVYESNEEFHNLVDQTQRAGKQNDDATELLIAGLFQQFERAEVVLAEQTPKSKTQ